MALFTSVLIGRAIALVLVYRHSIEIHSITKAEEGLPTSDFRLQTSLQKCEFGVDFDCCHGPLMQYLREILKFTEWKILVVRSGLDSVVPLCHFLRQLCGIYVGLTAQIRCKISDSTKKNCYLKS